MRKRNLKILLILEENLTRSPWKKENVVIVVNYICDILQQNMELLWRCSMAECLLYGITQSQLQAIFTVILFFLVILFFWGEIWSKRNKNIITLCGLHSSDGTAGTIFNVTLKRS